PAKLAKETPRRPTERTTGSRRGIDRAAFARQADESTRGYRMISHASARFARISPRKARMIVDLVRGRNASEALQLLQFTTKSGAPVIAKLLESAVANARQQSPGTD